MFDVPQSSAARYLSYAPGLALALALSLAATAIQGALPLIGAAAAAIVLGIALRALIGSRPAIAPGSKWAAKSLLKIAIVMLGADISLSSVWEMGASTFLIIVALVAASLFVVTWAGLRLGLARPLSSLIAVGTAICGASAIAAASPVVESDEDQTAYAISTIFAFNVLALIVYPIAGELLGLSPAAFGAWAGTAIHDTSSVVAAGYAYGEEAGRYATVVKLARTTLIIPVLILLAAARGYFAGRPGGAASGRAPGWSKAFPWFIVGFIAMAALRSAGAIPDPLAADLKAVAKFLIVVALAGVGLGADVKKLRSTGFRPLVLGLIASVFISVASLFLVTRFVS